MGGERDMDRLTKPKANYPLLVKKPVAKWFQRLYLDRIEGIYKKGSYQNYNLQAYVPRPGPRESCNSRSSTLLPLPY